LVKNPAWLGKVASIAECNGYSRATGGEERDDFSCMLFRKEIYTVDRHLQSYNMRSYINVVGKTMVKQNTINIYEIFGEKQHIGLKNLETELYFLNKMRIQENSI
jgi:hypothetical protein